MIDKFIDPQIRYLANNLTKMHLEIKRPDINGIINDLGNIRMLNTQSVLGGIGQIKNLFNAK
ncbi:hypothetical protein J5893_03510 [bacterium]|nr:hypothetical protein [bacterium]